MHNAQYTLHTCIKIVKDARWARAEVVDHVIVAISGFDFRKELKCLNRNLVLLPDDSSCLYSACSSASLSFTPFFKIPTLEEFLFNFLLLSNLFSKLLVPGLTHGGRLVRWIVRTGTVSSKIYSSHAHHSLTRTSGFDQQTAKNCLVLVS